MGRFKIVAVKLQSCQAEQRRDEIQPHLYRQENDWNHRGRTQKGVAAAFLRDIPTAHDMCWLLTAPHDYLTHSIHAHFKSHEKSLYDLRSVSVPSDQSFRWVSSTLNRLGSQSQNPFLWRSTLNSIPRYHVSSHPMRCATFICLVTIRPDY